MSGIYLNATTGLAANPYASFISTQVVANDILSDPSFASVNAFLNYPDPSFNPLGYSDALDVLNAYSAKLASNGVSYANNGFKFLLTLDDGTVIVDTSKTGNVTTTKAVGAVANGTSVAINSAASYGCKLVNENHNSRPEVLNAVLSASGVGSARRYSSSSGSAFVYYAVRLGTSPQSNIGTLRVAAQEFITASVVSGKPGASNDL